MKSEREFSREFVEENLKSYLLKLAGCDLEWIKLIMNISGVHPDDLKDVLQKMKGFGSRKRYKKIFEVCQDAGYRCEEIYYEI
jgi:hypothetical protein